MELHVCMVFFFFFQAEDGIRDWSVTGVQTCALPISWQAGAWVEGLLAIDVDATLITAHSDKQGAAGTYKGGFGFHPLAAWLDRGDGTGEPLAAVLRPGNAAANT